MHTYRSHLIDTRNAHALRAISRVHTSDTQIMSNTFKIAHFAREHNIDAKRARASLRRAMRANAKIVPFVVNDENARVAHAFNDAWTFHVRDRDRVARIIMNDTQFARYRAKHAKTTPAKTTPENVE